MRFLLFDVKPAQDAVQQYLDVAAALRPVLDALGGCLFIDRFRDMDEPRWLLSFQIWRDEQAIVAWRKDDKHRGAQKLGREEVFEDYRIRVGDVVAELSPGMPATRLREAPASGRYVVLADSPQGEPQPPARPVRVRRFASIYREGQSMHVVNAETFAEAETIALTFSKALAATRARICLVERDYGMHERGQAPQSFPPRSRN